MAWNKGVPSGTISPCASTVQITSNWGAINTWWGVEHYAFSSALSGMHKAGIGGVVLTGTYATIQALSNPGTGAIAFDNDCGIFRIYRSSNEWKRITEDHYSRVKLTLSSQSVASGTWTAINFDTEVYDPLSEYTTVSQTVRVNAEGYYLVQAIMNYPAGGDYEKAVGIYSAGSRCAQSGGYGTRIITVECVDVVKASASGLIQVYAYHTNTGGNVLVGPGTMILTRLS